MNEKEVEFGQGSVSDMFSKDCAECGGNCVEVVVEIDTNFFIRNHKPCLIPVWKCKNCGFKYVDDFLGVIASKIIVANEGKDMDKKQVMRVVVKKMDGTDYLCKAVWSKKTGVDFNKVHNLNFEDEVLDLVLDAMKPELKLIGLQNIESITFVRT